MAAPPSPVEMPAIVDLDSDRPITEGVDSGGGTDEVLAVAGDVGTDILSEDVELSKIDVALCVT